MTARRPLRLYQVAFLLALASIMAFGQSHPAYAQKVPEGFKAELLYRVPDIEHPSVVTCDDRGNLFVGEDPMDMRGPTTREFDRVVYLRWDADTGTAVRTVFCENLSAVFGLIWHDDALYVMHAPHYSMFRDTDGDGVADIRKDLADGFGPPAGVYGFNDHIVTGTRLGLDGLVYVSVGDKGIPKAIGSDGSTISLEGGGVVRMRLDGSQLEVVSSGTRNHLDVAMDSLDNIFTYDNTDDGLGWWTRFTHHIETGYFGYPYDYHLHSDRHLPRISEHGGGSPVGAACYRQAAWPEQYRENAFHCEWGKGKVQRFVLKRSGASFTAGIEDFMVSDGTEEFRPLDLCFSPDGKYMYVADWNFGGWVNPSLRGRLYRVSYIGGDVPAEPPRAGDGEHVAAQIQSLGHPARSERMRAQWHLAKLADPQVLREVLSSDHSNSRAKVHAIWTLNAIADRKPDFDPGPVWIAALADKDADVRGQAVRALGYRRLEVAVAPLSAALQDEDPGVRMRAAIALGRIGPAAAAKPLFEALGEQDVYARFAMVQALRRINDWKLAQHYLDAPNPAIRMSTILALTNVYDDQAVAALAWAVRESKDPAVRAKATEAIAEVHRKADPYKEGWWGTQPARGKPARPKKQEWSGTFTVMTTLRSALRADDDGVRKEAMQAINEIRDPESLPVIVAMATDVRQSEVIRKDALDALIAIGDPSTIEAIVQVVRDDSTPVPLLIRGLEGIGQLKAQAGLPAIEKRLSAADPAARIQALVALAQLQGKISIKRAIQALEDPEVTVQQAAVRLLGELAAQEAVPALIVAANNDQLRGDAVRSLSQIPDRRALGVYLDALADRNPQLRESARGALATIRESIGQDIIDLHQRNELPATVRGELQSIFDAPTPISSWHVVGPWKKEEEPSFDASIPADIDRPVMIGSQQVQWRQFVSNDKQGRVTLNGQFSPDSNVWVLAYTTVEAEQSGPTHFMLGSDDEAVLWINGEKLYEFRGNRGWDADQARGQVNLRKGTNHIWLLVGNAGGPWDFSLAIFQKSPKFAFLHENVPAKLDLSVYREHALKATGDPQRGRVIFADTKGVGCIKCHAVGGEGGKIGPDLVGVGAKYPREELIRSVLEPSNRVASGYQVTTVVTVEGKVLQGVVKSDTEEAVELLDAEGRTTQIPIGDIDERSTSSLSLMPNGLSDGLTLEAFADIIAYLESLKQDAPAR